MKELKVDTISPYQYTMVQSSKPRYFLGSVLAVAIVSFGCGAILGLLSSEIVVETNIIHEETKLASALPEKDNESSKLAWLMSFPNSGTSYTGDLIRGVTRTNSATNYGQYNLAVDGASELVFETSTGGPFWTDPQSKLQKPERGYILTKTHCGGRCDICAPKTYVESQYSFLKHCLETSYISKNKDGEAVVSVGSYDKDLVARIIHLIRDPFDNIVSRFHLRHNRFIKLNDTESLEKYPKSREGFRAYCNDLSEMDVNEEKTYKSYQDIFDSITTVPCHADFFRYIQWHNLAFNTACDLQIPSLVIHYENYTTNFDQTMDAIVDFLQLNAIHEAPSFIHGKTYRDYFTGEEIEAVTVMFEKLALGKTWDNTKHYFE